MGIIERWRAKKLLLLSAGRQPRAKRFFIWVGAVGLLGIILCGAAAAYDLRYQGRVYPGILAGPYRVGGLTTAELKNFIENFNNRYAKEGIGLEVTDFPGFHHSLKLSTLIASGDNAVELIHLDSEALARQAFRLGREPGRPFANLWRPLYYRFFSSARLPVPVIINRPALLEALREGLRGSEDQPRNANLAVASVSPLNYQLVPEKSGAIFDYRQLVSRIETAFSQLSFAPLPAKLAFFSPTITQRDAEALAPNLPELLNYGSLSLNHVDPQTKIRRDWNIAPSNWAAWLEIERSGDGQPIFSLSAEAIKKYLSEEVRPLIDREAQDAKFVVTSEKVEEFKASRAGLAMNADSTATALAAAFRERNYQPRDPVRTIGVVFDIIEPGIKTAEVNDLGITDIIGIGVSTFRDSHTNRIKNIAHAAERLNGVLIKPGEEFSALKYAGPFTAENGFLPEMVIKGKEIKPEVGGGMCQIGTTLFRMAMNSGMDITARRNHSLVVGYYADPVNGNPGTDATLYEPMLDLKFLNDTGSHLLLQTDIDFKRQQLTFTLWGRPDGRQGWYTHPEVKRWIPAGEEEEIEVSGGKLKPGERKCQNAFRGAVASFTYSRIDSGGKKIDRVFDSYYRPLPKICMVGVAASTTPLGAPVDLEEP